MTGNFFDTRLTQTPQLVWVKLAKYCDLSGETKEAVDGKRKNGLWIEGVQWKIAPDGNIWVNLMEVELWVQHGNIPGRLKYRRASKRVILKHVTA